MDGTVEQLYNALAAAYAGGGERAVERHRARGKLTARERVRSLLDEGTTFLELSALAAFGMYSGDIASAGVVSGIGVVHGQPCVIVANDATVKGGTYYPVSVAKHLRAQHVALANGLPCIYLVDSGGAHLPLQAEAFADRDHGGRLFYNQARMSAAGIPQVACVMGSCTAGGAYMPAMSDETVIVEGTGTVFLGGPPLVYAATGEVVSAEELGGAKVHARISGLTDHRAEDDASALVKVREIVERTLDGRKRPASTAPFSSRPLDQSRPQLDACSDAWLRAPAKVDALAAAADIVDDAEIHEFKHDYGKATVCGFAHVCDQPTSMIVMRGRVDSKAALKCAHFLQLARQRSLPVTIIHHAPPDDDEWAGDDDAARNRTLAALTSTLSTFPHGVVTLVVGSMRWPDSYSFGARAIGPRFLFTWPSAQVGDRTAVEATAQLHDDGIVVPAASRLTIAQALVCANASVATVHESIGQPVLRM